MKRTAHHGTCEDRQFRQGLLDTTITLENKRARGEDVDRFLLGLARAIEGQTLDSYRRGVQTAVLQARRSA